MHETQPQPSEEIIPSQPKEGVFKRAIQKVRARRQEGHLQDTPLWSAEATDLTAQMEAWETFKAEAEVNAVITFPAEAKRKDEATPSNRRYRLFDVDQGLTEAGADGTYVLAMVKAGEKMYSIWSNPEIANMRLITDETYEPNAPNPPSYLWVENAHANQPIQLPAKIGGELMPAVELAISSQEIGIRPVPGAPEVQLLRHMSPEELEAQTEARAMAEQIAAAKTREQQRIQELVEYDFKTNVAAGEGVATDPLFQELCLRIGIDPSEIGNFSKEALALAEQNQGLLLNYLAIRYQELETARQRLYYVDKEWQEAFYNKQKVDHPSIINSFMAKGSHLTYKQVLAPASFTTNSFIDSRGKTPNHPKYSKRGNIGSYKYVQELALDMLTGEFKQDEAIPHWVYVSGNHIWVQATDDGNHRSMAALLAFGNINQLIYPPKPEANT